jgi:hypothetical protein
MWSPTSKIPRHWQFVFSRRLLHPAAEWPRIHGILACCERLRHEFELTSLIQPTDPYDRPGLDGDNVAQHGVWLLLPTTTEHPTLAPVQADPVTINHRLGTYTNFCNRLDLAASAIPGAPLTNGTPFGVMVVVPAFADQIAIDIAGRLCRTTPLLVVDHGVALAVFGAHLRAATTALATRAARRPLYRWHPH